MNLKNQPPVFVPESCLTEIEKLSKAALMDIVWDYAVQLAANGVSEQFATHGPLAEGPGVDAAITEFRARKEIVLKHRQLAKEQAAA